MFNYKRKRTKTELNKNEKIENLMMSFALDQKINNLIVTRGSLVQSF